MKVIPNRILKASPEERELLRSDPLIYKIFWADELELLADPDTGFEYFIANFMVHSPVSGGGPEAMDAFPFQLEMARDIVRGDWIYGKPRRMGVTLIGACAYAVWSCWFKRGGEGFDVKVVSKGQTEADEIITNCKMIADALPEPIRPAYGIRARDEQGRPGKENNSQITFPERGHASIRAMTSKGARSFKASILIIDEQAWQDDAEATWIASSFTTEGGSSGDGQILIFSTGNGKTGKGKVFHDLYYKAKEEGIMNHRFFPWWARTDRTQEWYDLQAKKMTSIEKLHQELPANEEQMFSGYSEGSAYPVSEVIDSVALGKKLDDTIGTEEQVVPTSDGVTVGIDWGINSACAILVDLAGFGTYQIDELYSSTDDAEEFSLKIIERANKWAEVLGCKFTRAYYDAAGAQPMKSFARISQRQVAITKIPFSKYKLSTIQFTKLLIRRASAGEEVCYLAISPRCTKTIEQMKEIKHKDNGDFMKGDDHNIDAVIAGVAKKGVQWDKHNAV